MPHLVLQDLSLVTDSAPGLPGHHLESSERAKDVKLHKDEAAREFAHFNDRFRQRKGFKLGKVRTFTPDSGELRIGSCIRESTDSRL